VKGFLLGSLFFWQSEAMSFQIFTLLSADEIVNLRALLADQTFVDGRMTASGSAASIKSNLQFARGPGQPVDHAATKLVDVALRRSPDFSLYTAAKRWVPPSFSRYDTGMHYGDHIDAALMTSGNALVRTDFAMTLFVSDPDDYEGGALVLHSAYGEEEIKLAAGQAVVYTANLLHRVEPVTKGSRLVCITWIQSQICDERFREINYDLHAAILKVDQKSADPELINLLNKARNNLIRAVASGS
jgi:PKHD-type hydroxylase